MSLLAKRSLAAGEISPSLYARTDTIKYATGLRTCRNSIVRKFGGTQNRPGSQYLNKVKNTTFDTNPVRLIDFEFNDEQTYILEFGEQYVRFYQNRRPLLIDPIQILEIDGDDGGSALVITETFPANHGLSDDDKIYVYGMNGIIPDGNYVVKNSTSTTFELQDINAAFVEFDCGLYKVPFGAKAGEILELATNYLASDLKQLRYIQSADVIILTHNSYPIKKITRTGPDDWDWTYASFTIGTSIAAPTGTGITGGSSGLTSNYAITAVNAAGEESLSSATINSGDSIGTFTITFTPSAGAQYHKIYTYGSGSWTDSRAGVIGYTSAVATSYTFTVTAEGPLYFEEGFPPSANRNPFGSTNNYPKACGVYQQRLWLGNTNNNTEGVWGSRIGAFSNFNLSTPAADSESVSFTMAGRQVNSVEHFLDLAVLLIMTRTGEHTAKAPVITPTDIQLGQETYNGSNYLRPLVIDGSAVYVQSRGNLVRDIGFTFEADGYRGNDLTTFSAHLVEGYEIVAWDYQKIPNSIVWMVRDDGVLLSLTYIREQQILGWARHDFDGAAVEDVCCIPDGIEDALYLVLNRTIDGVIFKSVEVLAHRFITDSTIDYIGMDGAITYDGRNSDSTALEITGGTTWDETSEVEIIGPSGTYECFLAGSEVGNEIHFTAPDGTTVRITITSATETSAFGYPDRTIPVSLRDAPTTSWARAIKKLSGLRHLEGRMVSILGDSFVVASPYNPDYPQYTVTNGEVEFVTPRAVFHLGLPFISDIETLDIDLSGSSSIADKKKKVNEVTLQLEKTRGIWVGPKAPSDDAVDAIENLTELKIRRDEGYNDPVRLFTGKESVIILPEWNSNGRVFVRQVDPLPCSVLAVFPDGDYPIGGGS